MNKKISRKRIEVISILNEKWLLNVVTYFRIFIDY